MPNIAVTNRKGGVTKTTTTSNLAVCLAELGLRILAIDLDPQGHTTRHFGLEVDRERGSGAFHVLRHGVALSRVVVQTKWGVDVLSAAKDLAQAAEYLSAEPGAECNLRDSLEQRAGETAPYDVVLMDCPPNVGRLAGAGLVAAHTVLCPVTLDAQSIDGLAELNDEIKRLVQRRINPSLRLGAILEARTKTPKKTTAAAKIVHAELVRAAGGLLLRGTIRESGEFSPAWDKGVPITEYSPRSIGAKDFRAVARELRERGLA